MIQVEAQKKWHRKRARVLIKRVWPMYSGLENYRNVKDIEFS
jgi:hypothetical protein